MRVSYMLSDELQKFLNEINRENNHSIFTVCKNGIFKNSGLKVLRCSILSIVNKGIKETENLIFYSVRSNFISLINTKICIFTTRENTAFGIKIGSYTEKIKYPLYISI